MSKTLIHFVFFSLIYIATGNAQDKSHIIADIDFFNVSGKVKKLSEIRVGVGLSSTANFRTFASQGVNYYEHYFSKDGKLQKIENISPSYYAGFGFKIQFHRTDDSLIITQTSPHELYIRTYFKKGDTLSTAAYNKVEDGIDPSENYKQYDYLRNGENFIMSGYSEGVNVKGIYERQNFAVVTNQKGLDSLIYLKQLNNDSVLMYTVKYLQFDEKGNWLARQFVKNNDFPRNLILGYLFSYTLYREIEYYD